MRTFRIEDNEDFDEHGVCRDGGRLRVRANMMDAAPSTDTAWHKPGHRFADDDASKVRDSAYANYIRQLNDGPSADMSEAEVRELAERLAKHLVSNAAGRPLDLVEQPERPTTDAGLTAMRDAAYADFLRNMRAQHPSHRQ